MGGWPMRDLEGYIKWQRAIGAAICHECGAEGVEIRQVHDPLMFDDTDICKTCWDEFYSRDSAIQDTGPDWDDLPIVHEAKT